MKLTVLGFLAVVIIGLALQTGAGQTPADLIKVRGCLQGNGSTENPWFMSGVVMPPPPAAAPPAGARGDGAGRGGAGGAGAGGGAGGRGARGGDGAPAEGGRGGRGGEGGRGAAPAQPATPQQPTILLLTGMDMTPWRNMFVVAEGTLAPAPSAAAALREFRVETARSTYGDCK